MNAQAILRRARSVRWAFIALIIAGASSAQAGVNVWWVSPPDGTTVNQLAGATLDWIDLVADASATQGASLNKIEFFYGSTLIGQASYTSPHTYTWVFAPVGTYSVYAKATAYKNGQAQTATTAPVTIRINAGPTVTVTTPPANAEYPIGTTAVTFTASAADPDGDGVASVEFYDCDGNDWDFYEGRTTPPYTATWNLQPPYYDGSGTPKYFWLCALGTDNLGASGQVGNERIYLVPTTTMTSPADGASYSAGESITLSANVSPSDFGIQKVQYYSGTTLIGESTTAPFVFSWQSTASGTYQLTAKMVSLTGWEQTSAAINITVSSAPAAAQLYYIEVDHLDTPRLVADAAGTTVWKWDQQEPFGDSVADENPSGLGAFDLPLRLPGQRYDQETGLHYNYYRDYDPSVGRYRESDPVGLHGGINTYAYVLLSPLSRTDARGLFSSAMHYGMTYQAMVSEGYSPEAAREMAQRVVDVDKSIGGQMPWNAVQHAMCPPFVAKSECIRRINRLIEDQIYRCSPDSIPPGLHVVQDSGAGGHTGGQTYYGIPSPSHIMNDFFPSMREMDEAIARSRQFIRRQKEICNVCRP